MSMTAVVAIVAVYVVLAVLLLSLNIASLWRWWIKAGAIVVTTLMFIGSYFAITALLGWPIIGTMPNRFSLLSTRIVEPDNLRGLPGRIYLWVEEIDQDQIVISSPRAFEVPYTVTLSSEVAKAQEQIDEGSSIMGEYAADNNQNGEKQSNPTENEGDISMAGGDRQLGQSTGEGGAFADIDTAVSLTFSDMPPVSLPEKSPMLLPPQD